MTDAETMKKLREKRRKNNKCTRCGRKIFDKEKNICAECRNYLNYYKKNGEPPIDNKINVVNRSPVNNVKNEELVKAMREKSLVEKIIVTTKVLAEKIGSSQRSVQRWIFEGKEPSEEYKKRINNYFDKNLFNQRRK